jgi:hypothetical protein
MLAGTDRSFGKKPSWIEAMTPNIIVSGLSEHQAAALAAYVRGPCPSSVLGTEEKQLHRSIARNPDYA